MTDRPTDFFDDLAVQIVDGLRPDWRALERDPRLDAAELRALRILAASRWRNPETKDPRGSSASDLGAVLGAGASGSVHRALDPVLDRPFAVKMIAARGFASAAQRARFIVEARTLASVEHPNVVRIHGVEEDAEGVRLNLELIDGRTLDALVREDGPLGAEEAARIGIDLCRAAAAIHAQGLVHCDLKPANVMRERGGRIVVLDFGIARAARSDASDSARPGAGTPLFMAPEQFRGERDLGPPTDLFAIGSILYWLVTGAAPFEGDTYEALRDNVLAGRPVPLLDRRPDLPRAWIAVVERALESRPEDRFASAGEMERALRSQLTSEWAETRARRKAPWLRTAGVAAFVVLAGVLLWRMRGTGVHAPGLQCRLLAQRDGSEVALLARARVRVGDRLRLEVQTDGDLHVYVFDEDEHGELFALFPLAGFEPQNPLRAGVAYLLPGTQDGESRAWVVTSAGGQETILVAAAREPIAEFEALRRTVPAPESSSSLAARPIASSERGLVMRGLGATAPLAVDPPGAAHAGRLAEIAENFLKSHDVDRALQILHVQSDP